MNELVKIDAPELTSIEPSKAEQIKKTFEPMVKMLSEFEDAYNQVVNEAEKEITGEICAKAKRVRIDIGKIRIETEKIRKEQKEEYLRAGKAIDGVSNILKWAVTDKENKLKEIENHFEIQEQKRLQELQNKRVAELSKYIEDAEERDLSRMDEEVWQAYLSSKKKEYDDRIEAEKKAEEERIKQEKIEKLRWERSEIIKPYYQFFEDNNEIKLGELSESEFELLLKDLKEKKQIYDKEQEEIRLENERLKKEAEENEHLAKIEEEKRLKAEKERKLKEEAEKKEFEAKLKKEREEKEKIEAELKAKEEAEIKQKEEEEKQKQAELNKGDAAKIKDLVSDLESIKVKYLFKSAKNKKMYEYVNSMIDKIINNVKAA